jgi:hypothetical protein
MWQFLFLRKPMEITFNCISKLYIIIIIIFQYSGWLRAEGRGSISGRVRNRSLWHHVRIGPGDHVTSCAIDTEKSFPWSKAAGALSFLIFAWYRGWECVKLYLHCPYIFMAWCLMKHRVIIIVVVVVVVVIIIIIIIIIIISSSSSIESRWRNWRLLAFVCVCVCVCVCVSV